MISIIICSRTAQLSEVLQRNIKETIGCPYEIIVIDNSNNDYSIFSAYNRGIIDSKGDILCFMHEDIVFHSANWGLAVEKHLANVTIGLVGVFGSHFMPSCFPIVYWENPCSGALLQGRIDNHGNYKVQTLQRFDSSQGKSHVLDVAILDGLWFCGKRELFNMIAFDQNTFDGFHCYDLDICMQVHSNKKRTVVVDDVFLEHKSTGYTNDSFFSQLSLWYKKWEQQLPICKGMTMDQLPWSDYSLAGYYLRQKQATNTLEERYRIMTNSIPFKIISKITHLFHR